MSLALRHRQRMLGQQHAVETAPAAAKGSASTPANPAASAAASEYVLMRARLGNDIRRLREIQSVEKKIELKRDLLPEYDAWVQGVLQADTGAEDDVLTHVMIWRIDIGDFDGALALAEYVLEHNLTLPERFDRTPATLVTEEIAEAALKAIALGDDFDLATLLSVDALVEGEDMPDQVRAKLLKAIGILRIRAAEAIDPIADGPAGARFAGMKIALDTLRRAYGLWQGVGVKKEIERLEREIKKQAPPASAPVAAQDAAG